MPAPLVADAVKPTHVRPGATAAAGRTGPSKKIWIDLENTPHIPFFKPIIRELEQRGYTVVLTARDAFQVCELADKFGLPYKKSAVTTARTASSRRGASPSAAFNCSATTASM